MENKLHCHYLDFTKKQVTAFHWIITAAMNMSQLTKEWGQLTTPKHWVITFLHQWIIFSVAYSKTALSGVMVLKLWKSGSGIVRHHLYTWIFNHFILWTRAPLKILEMCLRRLHRSPIPSSTHLGKRLIQLWMEINVVTLHRLIKMMPWWIKKK